MAEQYLPLYRKYRPQEFSDLVGQENLVKAFTNAINAGKIAHAYLFCGPRGTGKTSSARILAKSLNCQNGPTLTPCGKCPSCLDILNGNMIDVIEMDAASNRSVEDAQNIIDKIHYAPVNGKYKIFIIDEVHMISKTAFNALLKTLEEPPENVIFILATTEPQKVLETIISRCQRFDFRRIRVDDIVKRLEDISKKEGIKISRDALIEIAKNSQGGMRDALALLDQISVLDVENEIKIENVYDMLGKIDNDTLINLSKYIFEKSVDNTVQKINEIYSKGNEPLLIIENLIQYLRNLTVVKTCHNEKTIIDLTLLSKDIIKKMQAQAQNISVGEISDIIEKLTYYYKEIKYTNNRYLWLELCFIDIASGHAVPAKEAVKTSSEIKTEFIKQPKLQEDVSSERNDIFEELSESKNVPNPPVTEDIVPNETVVSDISEPQKIKSSQNDWKNILDLIDSLPSRSFFSTFAKPVELNDKKVTITFKNETFGKRAKEPQKEDSLKKACLKFYNVASIELEIKIGDIPVKYELKKETKSQNQESLLKKEQMDSITDTEEEIPDTEDTDSPKTTEEYQSVEIDKKKETEYNAKYSDQVKMVKDLFDAKVFD